MTDRRRQCLWAEMVYGIGLFGNRLSLTWAGWRPCHLFAEATPPSGEYGAQYCFRFHQVLVSVVPLPEPGQLRSTVFDEDVCRTLQRNPTLSAGHSLMAGWATEWDIKLFANAPPPPSSPVPPTHTHTLRSAGSLKSDEARAVTASRTSGTQWSCRSLTV